MKLPREVSGRDLAKRLRDLGYEVTRRSGSHMRLTTTRHGEHHVTIPDHKRLRVGTLTGKHPRRRGGALRREPQRDRRAAFP